MLLSKMKEEFWSFLEICNKAPEIWTGEVFLKEGGISTRWARPPNFHMNIPLDVVSDHANFWGIAMSRLRERTVCQWLSVIKSLAS